MRLVRDDFLVKNPRATLTIFDCSEETTLAMLESALGAQSLFSDVQIVVIKNFFQHFPAQDQRFLKDTLAKLSGDDCVVFSEDRMPRKNAALFTWLLTHADTLLECKKLEGTVLASWVEDASRSTYGSSISTAAIRALILAVRNDLRRLDLELQKLSLYAADRTITEDDVELLVHGEISGDMFGLIESLAGGDARRTLILLKTQIVSGDDPHYIFSMYVYQIRTLLLVSSFYHDQGISDQRTIASALKLHPFVVQKSLGLLRRVSQRVLKDAHKALLFIDRDVKSGRRDLVSALEMFVVRGG